MIATIPLQLTPLQSRTAMKLLLSYKAAIDYWKEHRQTNNRRNGATDNTNINSGQSTEFLDKYERRLFLEVIVSDFETLIPLSQVGGWLFKHVREFMAVLRGCESMDVHAWSYVRN